MSSPVDVLIAHLDGVRERRPGQWLACCPAHDDRHPSLLIETGDDERVLVYCYAGCSAAEIVAAVGLGLGDLFACRLPDTPGRYRRRRPTLSARDAMAAIDIESMVVMVAAADIIAGRALDDTDMERILTARQRISRLREVVA